MCRPHLKKSADSDQRKSKRQKIFLIFLITQKLQLIVGYNFQSGKKIFITSKWKGIPCEIRRRPNISMKFEAGKFKRVKKFQSEFVKLSWPVLFTGNNDTLPRDILPIPFCHVIKSFYIKEKNSKGGKKLCNCTTYLLQLSC